MNKLLTATPIVKDKFWVVESKGRQIGSIQANANGGFSYVHGHQREYFPTITSIKQQYNIQISTKLVKKKKKTISKEIYGYPCHKSPFGEVFDVRRQLPVYSLNEKSKSFYCAGYYLINYNGQWIIEFCPKLIAINRYQFIGPFVTEDEAKNKMSEIRKGCEIE